MKFEDPFGSADNFEDKALSSPDDLETKESLEARYEEIMKKLIAAGVDVDELLEGVEDPTPRTFLQNPGLTR